MLGIAPVRTSYHKQTDDVTCSGRDSVYAAWRAEVAIALEKSGHSKEAEQFRLCADPAHMFTVDYEKSLPAGSIGVYVCEADPHHKAKAIAPMCRLRICPDCAHQHTARFLSRYVPVLTDLDYSATDGHSLKHIVLTTPISLHEENIQEKIKALLQAVPRVFDMLHIDDWRKHSGLLVAFEFGETGRKLHFHCIWFGKYIPQPCLSTAWRVVTGGLAQVVHIEQIDNHGDEGRTLESAVSEVAKYATKLAHKNADGTWRYMPAADVVRLFEVLKGVRRVRSYGLLYKIPEPERPHVCPVCHAAMLKLSPLEWDIWLDTGWLPMEFAEAIKPQILNLITGNNFCGLPPPENNVLEHFAVPLPTFEQLIKRPTWQDTIN